MKFGEISVADAVDAILAHKIHTDGVTFKKGRKLSEDDCRTLGEQNIQTVIAARLEPGDVHEDEAAATIAQAVSGKNVFTSRAFTGRCNLIAGEPGLVVIDGNVIKSINAVDESVTIATLPDLAKVTKGQVIATIKIIPFAVGASTMESVSAAAAKAIDVQPFHSRSVTLINTTTSSLKPSVIEKTTELTRQRVASVNGSIDTVLHCDHAANGVAETLIKAMQTSPDLIVVVGASVTVDRADVVPSGIQAAGGSIVHFGMPVDPGNLMLLADYDSVPVLVLPGCARSPKLNGIDWILDRFAAGIEVKPEDIMALGVGGLLVDSPARPLPREDAVRQDEGVTDKPKIAAIILAAGQSRRMGGVNKLLNTVDGKPLIRRTVAAVLESDAEDVVVVTGHDEKAVRQALDGQAVRIVHNPDYENGLSTSLQRGLSALSDTVDGALVCLGDMPDIGAEHLNALISEFDPDGGRAIGVPVHQGKRGNPVLWAQRFFDLIAGVKGDVGARHLIGDYEDLVYEVEFGDIAVLTDLDTPEDWSNYHSGQPS